MSEQDVRYWTSAWQPGAPPQAVTPRAGGRILLFTAEDDVEQAVRQAANGAEVVRARVADADPAELARLLPDRILIHRGPGEAADPEREFFLLFRLTQALMREKPVEDIKLIHAHVEEDESGPRPEYEAVGAFARVVRLEKPSFHYRGVAIRRPLPVAAEAATLLAEFEQPGDEEAEVRYEGGLRSVRRLRPLPTPTPQVPVRTGGVYVITGGLGGLGLVFARELTRHTPVNLVLTGRREADAATLDAVTALERNGSRIRYVRADVSTGEGVAAVVEEIRSVFGRRRVRGVIHSAGVIRDSFLLKKTEEEAAGVLAAKVRGTRLLDEALRAEPLDFFALFSSLASSLGNLGQADYAFANAYMDHYARWRESQRRRGQRSGRSVSIGWPLWDEGAMHASDTGADRARAALGLHPLTAAEGTVAFSAALACEAPQVVVIKGEERTWRLLAAGPQGREAVPAALAAPAASAAQVGGVGPMGSADAAGASASAASVGVGAHGASGSRPSPTGGDSTLRARTREYLRRLVARFTKLPVSEIRTDVSFGRYGVESIMIITMTQEMEGELGPLGKTLFFEYDSIDELADHLLRVKAEELRAHLGMDAAPQPQPQPEPQPQPQPQPKPAPSQPPAAVGGKWALLQARTRGVVPERPKPEPEPEPETEDIAVIGVSGRYPKAADLAAFWENLRNGTDCVTEIPARRWDHTPYFDSEKGKPGKSYSRWGGFIDGVELFDPLFFNISPVEAEYLDPQERLFLETSWQVIEDAGYAPGSLAGRKVGVFAGVMFGLYQLLATDKHGGWLNGNSSYASVANRVSYFFDFHGPSLTIDSMCSSSLVAVHQACTSIRNGESELAIAGGVNLIVHPSKYVQLSQGNFLSTDGRCRAFGAGGDGYVPGEGVGAVLLKSLSKARADGDQVYAVIKASAVNAGGRTSGYSVPNPQAQAELIGEALDAARVDPRSISYVEAHGTGTALGDPIEITGLTKAYRRGRRATADRQFCAIGSVKSNVGHLESAAGIAALTKVILQMRHRQLVPSLHAATLNPLIDFEDSPFYVQRELGDWAAPEGGGPRRAAISAFGAGGTNAHLIVEEAEQAEEPPREPARGEQIFLLSARTEDGLAAYARQLLAYLSPPASGPEPGPGPGIDAGRIREEVRDAVAEVLGLPAAEIDEDEAYADLGLDAYGLAACHERVRERLGVSFPGEVLRLEPSPGRTAAHLARLFAPKATDPAAEPAIDPADLAFTLQTGREAMAERLAITADGLAGLREGLAAYLERRTDVPGLRHGGTEAYDRKLHSLLHHDVTRTYARQLLAEGRLDEAAELWVMGADVDWPARWEGRDRHARRVSLPTYPFEREVHWIVPVGPEDPLVPGANANATVSTTTAVPATREAAPERQALDDDALYAEVLAGLKRGFATALNIPEDRLRPHTPFENYGIDSIRITQLNRVLEQSYDGLPSSLLFTYKTLDEVARYLCGTHRERAVRVPSPAPEAADSVGDIAIIGLSGRYPQAASLAEFGANLAAGRDCVTEIPKERWDHHDYPEIACRWGGFIDDARAFDPGFFNLSPNNAAYMDPQERLFVQSVWHCLEDAGYTPEALADPDAGDRRGNVAVYAGVSFNEYGLFGAADLAAGKDVPIDSQLYSVANRISYLLNLRGPSLVVDTACSSSAYAIHLACQALKNGDCDLAIAGGVNLSLHPSKYLTLNMFSFLSTDGHCKSFGAGGDGYVPGEGVGTLLLKPLARAEADGDHIYGVIKGSAVNHGGKTHGYTVPNPVAQAEVVRDALQRAGVTPDTISYLEAHGTGTSLGDTIEIEALSSAFGGYPDDGRHCAIGSVKSNIGHLEAAAGVSGVTKVLLQFQARQLFPSRLNSDRLNPEIDFERTPFRVQLDGEPWEPPAGAPRRAGISSFGVGGVNVHLVLEEYAAPPRPRAGEAPGPQLVPLSARTPEALLRYAAELHAFLQREAAEPPDLADMAFTLRTGRRAFPCRVAFVASDHAELAGQLKAYVDAGGRIEAEPADELELPPTPGPRRRVSLPGYPFEKETYWLYEAPVRGVPAPAPQEAAVAAPPADGADQGFLARLAEAFANERLEMMTAYVQQQFAELLGFTEGRLPDADEGFFELGIDSITSTQAHNLLEGLFGKELDLQLFFNYPSIREVSQYLLGLLDDAPTQEPEPEPEPEESAPTWLFTREWRETDATPEAGSEQGGGTVLLLDTGDRLRAALPAERVILVRPGDGFRATGEDTYELDPAAWGDYHALFQALSERGITIDRAIHFWPFRSVDLDLEQGVYALTALTQAALAAQPRQRLSLLYAFAGQGSTTGGTAAPENRGVGGFIRAARMDNPLLAYKTVEFTRANLGKARVAAALMAEFGLPEQDVEVRHDGKRRWVRAFRPVPTAEIEAAADVRRFTTGGVYLITGGPRGLAGLFGRYLAGEHSAQVVLVGRREADAEALAELESYGAAYLRADVGDRDAVEGLVAEVKARYGRINGVVHAAGALRDGSIQNKKPEEMAEVFRAKVSGTRNLDEALKDEPLDCFVLFSSLAAVMGNFGQSDYCYANAFLDAFAEHRERRRERGERSGHTLSVNWSFWRTGGMETSDAILTWMRNRLGTVVFDGPDGWHALRTSLGLAHPQVVTVKGDIDKITRMLGVPEADIATTLPLEPEPPVAVPTAYPTELIDVAEADAEAVDAIDAMDEQDLVALLQKEIDITMNEGADVA